MKRNALLAAAGLASTIPLLAQQPAVPTVSGRVEAVAAEIEVLVLDPNGKPISGVAKGDLKLFVNGRETPIDYLEAPSIPSSAAAAASPSGAPPSAVPATAAPVAAPHSTIYLLNPLHLDARSRQNGLVAWRRHAESLPPGEPAAVYVIDNGLRQILPFSTDRKELRKALDRAEKGLPASYNFDVGSEEWIGRTRQEFRAITTMFDSVAGRPEAKTTVMLAGSVAATGLTVPIGGNAGSAAVTQKSFDTGRMGTIPGGRDQSVRGDTSAPLPRSDLMPGGPPAIAIRGAWSFLLELKDVASAALLARATIVAVDPTELTTDAARAETNSLIIEGSLFDVALTNMSLRGTETPVEGNAPDAWAFRGDSFAVLAAETGGARLGYTNKPAEALAAESARLGSRYRLGFTPPDGTSARRAIRVEAARTGLLVSTAPGQRSRTPETSARARFAALLLSAEAPKADFAVALETKGPVKGRTDDAFPFDVLVPVSAVFAEETSAGKRAKLELFIAVVDGDGRASDPMVIPFSVTLGKDADAAGAFFRKDARFNLDHRWKGRLFVGVRDVATNRFGAVALPIGS